MYCMIYIFLPTSMQWLRWNFSEAISCVIVGGENNTKIFFHGLSATGLISHIQADGEQ